MATSVRKSDIAKEIDNLQPSSDLLNYYRKKVLQFERDREESFNLVTRSRLKTWKLDLMKKANSNHSWSLASSGGKRYKNISTLTALEEEKDKMLDDLEELRAALSDINIFIHSERQQVAKLLLENELLKTNMQLADKKIDILLELSGLNKFQLKLYLSGKKPLKTTAAGKLKRQSIIDNQPEKSIIEENLEKKVKLLEDNFETSKRLWVEERNSLTEDRAIKACEQKAYHKHCQAHLKLLTSKLVEAEKVASEATKKALAAKYQSQKSHFLFLAEKEKLLSKLERFGSSSVENKDSWKRHSLGDLSITSPKDSCEVRQIKREMSSLKKELRESEDLKCLYEGRCRKLEQVFCHERELKDEEITMLKEKLHKMNEEKRLYKKQRDKLEARKRIEAEGFSNELKLVKVELQNVIRQFFKLTNFYCQNEDLSDSAKVKDIRLVSSLARNVHLSIIEAKRKMFSAERTCNPE